MAKLSRFFVVHLTKEALASLSDTFMKQYVQFDSYLACTSFIADSPYCQVIALPNEANKTMPEQEFLLPSYSVACVTVGKNEKIFGFPSQSN